MNFEVIVTGPFASGKTTLISTISNKIVTSINVAINIQGDYIGMDYGLIDVSSDLTLTLLGTPSTKRFSFDWHISTVFMGGYIIVVDSSKPETFRESKGWIEHFRGNSPKPFIVAANKQDKEGAWLLDDLRLALNIPPEISVVPCVATDKESVKRVLWTMVDGDGGKQYQVD